MRTRRIHRLGPAGAGRLVGGDLSGPELAALDRLLGAARAPAAPPELIGEWAAVAAFRAHHARAARAARRPARVRSAVVAVTTGLALFVLGGTAVAARTGNLPPGAQQHAHRLFSALGVPAPRTGPRPSSRPAPSASPPASPPARLRSPATPSPSGPAPRPSPSAYPSSVSPVTQPSPTARSTSPSVAESGARYASPSAWERSSPGVMSSGPR